MLHLLIDTLRNSVLITGIVIIMMMMIESFNLDSHSRFFNRVKGSSFRQVLLAALLDPRMYRWVRYSFPVFQTASEFRGIDSDDDSLCRR